VDTYSHDAGGPDRRVHPAARCERERVGKRALQGRLVAPREDAASAIPALWSGQQETPGPLAWGFCVERVTRIELALSAWEATMLERSDTF